MPKRNGIIFVIAGAVLILSALLLFLYNGYEENRAGQEAEILLDDIRSITEQKTEPTTKPTEESTDTTESAETVESLDPEMPVVEIDGYEYIGYVSIPDLELELPVMAEWNYKRLKIAPCRNFGSSRTDDLVIAAHNYKTHFGSLSSLGEGAEIIFTDMDGIENRYALQRLETLAPDAVDAVRNSGYDLVLYTCTPGGATRVVAFCDRWSSGPSYTKADRLVRTWRRSQLP